MRLRSALQPLQYLWALPTTSVGLIALILSLLSGGRARLVQGVLEVHGGFATWFLRKGVILRGGASAMTLGHVVIGQDLNALDWSRSHERVHVRQVERWGPFFLPVYGLASLWCYLRGKDPYRDNFFEVEAYRDG